MVVMVIGMLGRIYLDRQAGFKVMVRCDMRFGFLSLKAELPMESRGC